MSIVNMIKKKQAAPLDFRRLLFLFSLLWVLVACQEEIDLDLDISQPLLVIESNLTLTPYRSGVMLSKTGGFYEFDSIQFVNDADVFISDSYGNIDTLQLYSDGIYTFTKPFLALGETYYLKVEYEGHTYTASTYIPTTVALDTVFYHFQANFGPGSGPNNGSKDSLLVLNIQFDDDGDYHDYYHLLFYKNHKFYMHPYIGHYVFDDEMFNGITFPFPVRLPGFQSSDTLGIELHHITKETFDYYRTLNNIISKRMGGGTPYNPLSNIRGGALGYFGGYGMDGKTVELK
jgi:hypothetical protein